MLSHIDFTILICGREVREVRKLVKRFSLSLPFCSISLACARPAFLRLVLSLHDCRKT